MRWMLVVIGFLCAFSAAQTPLKKGMELRYEGEAKLQYGKEPFPTQPLQVTDLVTEVTEDGKAVVASLRVFQIPLEKTVLTEAVLRFLEINTVGKVVGKSYEQLITESPYFFPIGILPLYFVPTDRLKEGNIWTAKEQVFQEYPTKVIGEVRYQVKGKEKVGGVECWLITRTLLKPLTVSQREQITKIADTLWVERKSGLIQQVWREFRGVEKELTTTLTLRLTLKSVRILDEQTLAQRLKELQAVKTVQQKLGIGVFSQPTEETLTAAEQAIADFLQRYGDSPYSPYMETWKGFVQRARDSMQKRQQRKEMVGQPAPDFELTAVDGKRKVKLSDFQGKVVLLNFFAHW